MPKLKQPSSLKDICIESLGMYVFRVSRNAIRATTEINANCLHRFLHGDLPRVLSKKVTVHMFSVVTRLLEGLSVCEREFDERGNTNVKKVIKSVILASIFPHVCILDMSAIPRYIKRILTENICAFKKLHTLNATRGLPHDVTELLPNNLCWLKCLVNFRLWFCCTDAIINALVMGCSETIELIDAQCSTNVTSASFQLLMKCHKLKHLSISGTSVTAEGYVHFLQNIQKSNITAKDFLHISLGRLNEWQISSRQLSESAIAFPMLKHLEIEDLHGDMEKLYNLTQLKVLKIYIFDYHTCNLDGFLRLRGNNLILLKLSAVSSPIDLKSLMIHCINLKELTLYGCSIMDITLKPSEKLAKSFPNLEILDFYCQYSLNSIELILSLCINIKSLWLNAEDDEEDITDEFILRLLSNNPMQKLTKFSTTSKYLSLKSANAIIEQCPLLETLEELDLWNGVTDTEIKTLRKRIRDKNLDLSVNLFKDDGIYGKSLFKRRFE